MSVKIGNLWRLHTRPIRNPSKIITNSWQKKCPLSWITANASRKVSIFNRAYFTISWLAQGLLGSLPRISRGSTLWPLQLSGCVNIRLITYLLYQRDVTNTSREPSLRTRKFRNHCSLAERRLISVVFVRCESITYHPRVDRTSRDADR